MSESRQRVKLELEATNPFTLVDKLTGLPVVIPRGVDLQLELLRLFAGALVDISDYNSITVEVQASRSTSAANLMTKTLAFGSFTLNPTLADWQADVVGANSQHAIITFTNQETNLDLGGLPTKDFWLVVSALTKDSPARRITLGCSLVTFAEDGSPLDAPGPVQGNNLVPGGATYDGAGHYTLNPPIVVGKVYTLTKGVNDTSYTNGGGAITADGDATAVGTTFPLTGTPGALVTYTVRLATYLTQAESDARYGLAGNEAAQDAATAAAQATANTALANAATAEADAQAARSAYFAVADQAAMLALTTAKHGDVAERADNGYWYWLSTDAGGGYATLANWKQLPVGLQYVGQWVAGTTYAINKLVTRTGSIYLSIQGANTGHIPETSPTWWTLFMAAGSLQLTDNMPAEQFVADTGQVGTGTRAAREDHAHPMPDLASKTEPGFESAADKFRFDYSEIGGANGSFITCAVKSGNWIYLFGDFRTWDNVAAPGIVKIDRLGHVDPLFNPGVGLAVGDVIWFAAVCGDGDIVFGGNAKTSYNGAAAAWLHKITPLGTANGAFTSPAAIANTGTDILQGLVALANSRIAAISFQTLRVMDLTGTTLAHADADGLLGGIANTGYTDPLLLLTMAKDVSYDGVLISHAVKLLDLTEGGGGAFTMAQSTAWLAGATAGGGFSGNFAKAFSDGSYYIVGNYLSNAGTDDYKWNAGAQDAKGLIKLLPNGTQDHTFAPLLTGGTTPLGIPLAIDSQGRVYFTGDFTTINGTTVPTRSLCRVDHLGANLKVFSGFNGRVSQVTLVDDDHILVAGWFTQYGQLPTCTTFMMDSTGARIESLATSGGGGGGVDDDENDYIYIDAGAGVPRLTGGATPDTVETPNYYLNSDIWKFAYNVQSHYQFKLMMPDRYDLGNIKLKIDWQPGTGAAAAEGVVFGVSAGARSDGDVIDAALGTVAKTTDAVQAVGKLHQAPVFTLTIGGAPQLGDMIWFDVTNVIADGGYTTTHEVQILGIQIQLKKLTAGSVAW